MRVWVVDLQFDRVEYLPSTIDFDDPRRSALGNHHAPVGERLKGMDFHGPAGIAI